MRIEIFPEDLARQLPELRSDIIQTYSKKLVLEGVEYRGNKEKRLDVLVGHPEWENLFTTMELSILAMLLDPPERIVPFSEFMLLFKDNPSNNKLIVHIKNMRDKCKRKNVELDLRTIRGLGYKLVV